MTATRPALHHTFYEGWPRSPLHVHSKWPDAYTGCTPALATTTCLGTVSPRAW